MEEMQELLVVGVEFSDLGMEKMKAEHPVPRLDNLLTRLEERHPSNYDVLASPEQYIEEIGATDYIWDISVDPAIVAGVDTAPRTTVL